MLIKEFLGEKIFSPCFLVKFLQETFLGLSEFLVSMLGEVTFVFPLKRLYFGNELIYICFCLSRFMDEAKEIRCPCITHLCSSNWVKGVVFGVLLSWK